MKNPLTHKKVFPHLTVQEYQMNFSFYWGMDSNLTVTIPFSKKYEKH